MLVQRSEAARERLALGVREAAAQLLVAAGAPVLARRLNRKRLTILMYHGVENEPLTPPCAYVQDVDTLRRELRYVRKTFNVLPLEEALERLYAGKLPDRSAVITFDDGTRNLLTCAAPVLRELGVPAAVFLATGPMGTEEVLWPDRLWLAFARTKATAADLTAFGLGTVSLRSDSERGSACGTVVEQLKDLPDDQRIERIASLIATLDADADADAGPFRVLSWSEAHELAEDGSVTLGTRSVTQPILSRCTDDKVEREVLESCAVLERETGSVRPKSSPTRTAVLRISTNERGRHCGAGECPGHSRRSSAWLVATPIRWRCRASRSPAVSRQRPSNSSFPGHCCGDAVDHGRVTRPAGHES